MTRSLSLDMIHVGRYTEQAGTVRLYWTAERETLAGVGDVSWENALDERTRVGQEAAEDDAKVEREYMLSGNCAGVIIHGNININGGVLHVSFI